MDAHPTPPATPRPCTRLLAPEGRAEPLATAQIGHGPRIAGRELSRLDKPTPRHVDFPKSLCKSGDSIPCRNPNDGGFRAGARYTLCASVDAARFVWQFSFSGGCPPPQEKHATVRGSKTDTRRKAEFRPFVCRGPRLVLHSASAESRSGSLRHLEAVFAPGEPTRKGRPRDQVRDRLGSCAGESRANARYLMAELCPNSGWGF